MSLNKILTHGYVKPQWCDNNPSADKESIISHWLYGCFTPDRSDEERFYAAVGMRGGYATPETMLWLAAIWQAIMDLENPVGKDEDMIRFDALSWVMDTSDEPGSFNFACDVLGMNARIARERIVGNRKVKLPAKINTCPDCGVFIRTNLKRCEECRTIQKNAQMAAWYRNNSGTKYQREYKRQWRAKRRASA